MNRRIWEELCATSQKSEDAETLTAQPTTEQMGEASVHQAGGKSEKKIASNQHWVAVGTRTTDCAPSVGRSETDGILLKVKIQLSGRSYVALVDSGASRCYASPATVDLLEQPCIPELVHLELADSSKICSTQKVQDVKCVVGNTVCRMDLTVTNLLHDVDVILGMTWLQVWNPLIDWVNQVMYIRTEDGWDKIRGLFLDAEHAVGTVKILDNSLLSSIPPAPDFSIIQKPQFWDYTASGSWTTIHPKGTKKGENAQFCNSLGTSEHSGHFSVATQKVVQYNRVAKTVQKKT